MFPVVQSEINLNTLYKELGGALLLPHHATVSSVICQRAVVDGEVAHVPNALKDVPGRFKYYW